jgi:hypothetical protein
VLLLQATLPALLTPQAAGDAWSSCGGDNVVSRDQTTAWGGKGRGFGSPDASSGLQASGCESRSNRDQGESTPQSRAALNPRQLTKWITASGSIDDLGQLVQECGRSMDYIHVTAACTRLARLQGDRAAKQALADVLLQLLQPLLPECGARECAHVMYSMARMQHCPRGMLIPVLGQLLTELHAANAQACACATATWALAELGSSDSPAAVAAVEAVITHHAGAVSSLVGRLISKDILSAANAHSVANVMRALAKLGSSDSPAAVAAVEAALTLHADAVSSLVGRLTSGRVLMYATAQRVVDGMWALAKLGSSDSPAAVAAVEAALTLHAGAVSSLVGRMMISRVLVQATSQQLAGVLWALAVLSDVSCRPQHELLQLDEQSAHALMWQLLAAMAQAPQADCF